ncbi:hypothetical protein Aph02nite_90120 [Actinoplanes philippinensis]|nr:hypothetical protein Aph02nite_90120 [Actinoplanes philippinensis]
MGVRAGAAVLATLGLFAVGGAAQAAPAHGATAVQAAPAGCAEILQQIENLEFRLLALQDRLRHAGAAEKPAIVRAIVEVQARLAILYEQLETC